MGQRSGTNVLDLASASQVRRPRARRTRRRKQLALLWPLELATVAAFWGGCALLPAAAAARFGAWLGSRVGPYLRHHARIRQNLALALPTASAGEIEGLARACAASLGATLAEYPHLGTLADGAELVIDPACRAYARTGRPAIFVSGHFGNWEIQTVAASALGLPLSLVYRRKDNPLLEWLVQRCRRPLGCRYLPSNQGARPLLGELRAGRSLALLVDLRVDSGDLLPFFGQPAYTTLVPARLAQHVGCALVPAHAQRLRPGAHRVILAAPIWPDPAIADRDEQTRAMMIRVNRAIESWVRERPQEWVPTHHRWPKAVRRANAQAQARSAAARTGHGALRSR